MARKCGNTVAQLLELPAVNVGQISHEEESPTQSQGLRQSAAGPFVPHLLSFNGPLRYSLVALILNDRSGRADAHSDGSDKDPQST